MKDDGTIENRKTFAFVHSGAPDGTVILQHYASILTNSLIQVFTAIRGVMFTQDVAMGSMYGIHKGS